MNPAHKKVLTAPQRREILYLQAEGFARVTEARRIRIFNTLLRMKIVTEDSTREFRLVEEWKPVDVSFKTRGERKPYKKEMDYNPQYMRRFRPMKVVADEQPKKVVRFTEYSNVSREQHLQRIEAIQL